MSSEFTLKKDLGNAIVGVQPIKIFTEHFPTNQSLTAREIAKAIAGENLIIEKDEAGKPLVINTDWNVSLSHSKSLAAAILSKKFAVGIDIETIHPRILRIAHKFLKPKELEVITTNKIETLLLYWSAKEALYKVYAKRHLDFAEQLIIQPFSLQQKGVLKAGILLPEDETKLFADLEVSYEFLDGHVMAYVIGR